MLPMNLFGRTLVSAEEGMSSPKSLEAKRVLQESFSTRPYTYAKVYCRLHYSLDRLNKDFLVGVERGSEVSSPWGEGEEKVPSLNLLSLKLRQPERGKMFERYVTKHGDLK